jgi:hypothetical protein
MIHRSKSFEKYQKKKNLVHTTKLLINAMSHYELLLIIKRKIIKHHYFKELC